MKTKRNKLVPFILLAMSLFSFISCSKDNDKRTNSSSKLVFKAEASAGSSINMTVYGYDATLTTASSLTGTAWTSPEISAPANANVASFTVNGMGSNAASTLKVQIYVNGVLKKEGTSTGTALSASAQYNLR